MTDSDSSSILEEEKYSDSNSSSVLEEEEDSDSDLNSDSKFLKLDPDLIKKIIHSLDPDDYIQFMKEVHVECPFTTREMTNEIVNHWINDHSMKIIEEREALRKQKARQDRERDLHDIKSRTGLEVEQFQEIVTERKAEHIQEAQEKRHEDLRRIQEMKSKTGLDPLQLFPKEIWMTLLDEVLPEDKHTLREVHKIFCDLTEDTLVGDVLLPMILGFKVDHFWEGPPNSSPVPTDTAEATTPVCPLAQYAPLRLVSKSLRNAVDRFFEDDLTSKLGSGNKEAQPLGFIIVFMLKRNDYDRMLKLKQDLKFNNNPPQRFFTRSLSLISKENFFSDHENEWVDHKDQFAEFPEIIHDLLDHIGDQIWYFSFEFHSPDWYSSSPVFLDRYIFLLGCLTRMPKLKWLKLSLAPGMSDPKSTFQVPEGSSPPPTLSQLERLDLEMKLPNRFILPVFMQFWAANSHVKTVNLLGLKCILNGNNGFNGSDFESARRSLALEVLNIDGTASTPRKYPEWHEYNDPYLSSSDDEDNKDDGFDDVSVIQSIILSTKWPLKAINWELKKGTLQVYSIFRLLQKLQTLEKIRLSIDDINIGEDIAFLKLPQLTHFEFEFDDPKFGQDVNLSFFFGLQFLLYANKLKSLTWKCDMDEGIWNKLRDDDIEGIEELGEMIEFGGGLCEIKESNIWSVFPWLDTISLELILRYTSSGKVKNSVVEEHRRRDIDFS